MNHKVTIITTGEFILLSVLAESEKPLSWEELYEIKESLFPDKVFIEIYPLKKNVINQVNQRHLYHVNDFNPPCLTDLENVTNYNLIEP